LKTIDIHQVDAFTSEAFGGNPAGVVPDASLLTDEEMQKIAREMALSETAFVTKGDGEGKFRVRFFTPTTEVALCGHATIGTFFFLAEAGVIRPAGAGEAARVTQITNAGDLRVGVSWRDGKTPSCVMMEQNPVRLVATVNAPDEMRELSEMLRAPAGSMRPGSLAPAIVSTGLPDLIIPLRSRDVLWALKPDLSRVADWCRERGAVSVHCFAMDPIDPAHTAHCRDFSPVVGVPEESATGTASGATAGYMVLNGLVKAGPVARIIFEQGHILKRPSTIYAEVTRDARGLSVWVGGKAVTVLSGRMSF